MARIRSASDRDKETSVRDQPIQRLLAPAALPEEPFRVARDVPGARIAPNKLAEKRILAQRYRFFVKQLLERALHGLTLGDLLGDAIVGELLLDARWQTDGDGHASHCITL